MNQHPLLVASVVIRPALAKSGPILSAADGHPVLPSLASYFFSLNLGALQSSSGSPEFIGDISAWSPTPGQSRASTTLLPPSSAPINSGLGLSGSALIFSPPPALSTSLPSPADLPSSSPGNPSTLQLSSAAGPLAFELSPFAPLGLGIVPIPVPRGLEESLADLFGNPPSTTPPPMHVPLGESNAAAPEAIRDGVMRLLQENATSLGSASLVPYNSLWRGLQTTPQQAVEVNTPPRALPDDAILAGSPLDPSLDEDGEDVPRPSAARLVLGFFAAGVVRLHRRGRRTSRKEGDAE